VNIISQAFYDAQAVAAHWAATGWFFERLNGCSQPA